jgi:hypothetical protein
VRFFTAHFFRAGNHTSVSSRAVAPFFSTHYLFKCPFAWMMITAAFRLGVVIFAGGSVGVQVHSKSSIFSANCRMVSCNQCSFAAAAVASLTQWFRIFAHDCSFLIA